MSSKKSSSKLSKYLKAPVRMLIKARDFYVRSITACSDSVVFSSAGGLPVGPVNTLPRSFSTNSSRSSGDEDFRELVRANSTKILGEKIELEEFQRGKRASSTTLSPKTGNNNKNDNMPRSNSAVIWRIDEDKPCCDFQDDFKMKPAVVVYPRSKSYAVSRKTGLVSDA